MNVADTFPPAPETDHPEPTAAIPPEGFGWVSRANVTNMVTQEPIPFTVLAGLPDGMLEQVPITDGLTWERAQPRSKYRQR